MTQLVFFNGELKPKFSENFNTIPQLSCNHWRFLFFFSGNANNVFLGGDCDMTNIFSTVKYTCDNTSHI